LVKGAVNVAGAVPDVGFLIVAVRDLVEAEEQPAVVRVQIVFRVRVRAATQQDRSRTRIEDLVKRLERQVRRLRRSSVMRLVHETQYLPLTELEVDVVTLRFDEAKLWVGAQPDCWEEQQ